MPIEHTPLKSPAKKLITEVTEEKEEEEDFLGFEDTEKRPPRVQAMAKKISVLSRQRAKAAEKVKRIGEIIIDPSVPVPLAKLKVYAKNVDAAYTEFNEFHNKLAGMLSEDELDEHDNAYTVFENVYHEVSAYVEEMLMDATKKEVQPTNSQVNQQVIVQQRPLKAPIPTFDGRYENWPKFKAMFLDIMAKSNDTNAIKLYHLDKALVGAAAGILDAKTMNENNYEHAWKILTERYENPRVIINTHIRGLLSLKKMTKESYRELRQLVDECTRHIESLRYLEQDLLGMSELIVIHLLASALDTVTRKLWETTIVRGKLPKYDAMIAFLKQQCDILENCEHLPDLRDTHLGWVFTGEYEETCN